MKVGSLFSGIGGLDLALEAFGGEVVWQADSDPFCRAVLAKHWPGVRCYEDVRDIDAEAERVDVICGGFPCQDISDAGLRAGLDGERSGLWREYVRIIRDLRPAVVFVENVSALLDRGLGRVLADLSACGFNAEWGTLHACAIGASHPRERLFIVAYANGERRQEGLWLFQGRKATRQAIDHRQMPEAVRLESDGELLGMANGLPRRVDAMRALGNAVVPAQAALAWEVLTSRAARTEAA